MNAPLGVIIVFVTVACVTLLFCIGYCITKYCDI